MLIRHLELGDLDELLALYVHLHDSDAPLPERAIVEGVWSKLAANPGYLYYGDFVGGSLVSSCTLTIVPNLTRGCRPYGVIENGVTHVAHRRRGYAKAVLLQALKDAWAANCYKVMLLTGRKDEATFRFYESVGSTETANKHLSPNRQNRKGSSKVSCQAANKDTWSRGR